LKDIRYYKGCKDIPVFNFFQCLETNSYLYLIKDWDEESEIKVDESDLRKRFDAIYEEYCKMSEDNSSLMYFALFCELTYLETRFSFAQKLLTLLAKRPKDNEAIVAYAEELRGWDYKMNLEKPFSDEMNRLVVQLKQSQNKIRLKQNELELMKPEENDTPSSFMDQLVSLEVALEKNEINPRTTTLEKWISLIKNLKAKNEQLKKRHGREQL